MRKLSGNATAVLTALRTAAAGIVMKDDETPGAEWRAVDATRARPDGMSAPVFTGCLGVLAKAGLYVGPILSGRSHGIVNVAKEA
jgi:hypothetical protein